MYPEYEWKPWNCKIPNGYWNYPPHHREYFDHHIQQRNLSYPNQLYSIKYNQLSEKEFLQVHYNSSISQSLEVCYPEYHWNMWQFHRVSPVFWDDVSHHRQYFDWLAQQLDIQNMDDWAHITTRNVLSISGLGKNISHPHPLIRTTTIRYLKQIGFLLFINSRILNI